MKHGSGIVRLSFPGSTKTFAIHTDLLCAHSKFFRRKFQPRRQDIEGNCSICHGDLDTDIQDITFCNGCGGNFHLGCINQWRRQPTKGGPAPCPLCRQKWSEHKLHQRASLRELSAASFEIYYDWLYTRRIQCVQELERDRDGSEGEDGDQYESADAFFELTTAYEIGIIVDDDEFCAEVLNALVRTAIGPPGIPGQCVVNVCNNKTPLHFRQIMVELYICMKTKNKIRDELSDWYEESPVKFFQDVAMALLGIYQDGESKRNADKIKEMIRLARVDGMDVDEA